MEFRDCLIDMAKPDIISILDYKIVFLYTKRTDLYRYTNFSTINFHIFGAISLSTYSKMFQIST